MEERTIAKKYRRPAKTLKIISILLPFFAMMICVLGVTHSITMLEFAYLYLLLLLLLPLCFIWIPPKKTADRDRLPWYDLLLACLSFFLPLYFFLHADVAIRDWGVKAPTEAVILSIILWAILLEAARRAVGFVFFVVVLFFSTYPLFGFIMPGPMWAQATGLTYLAAYHTMGMDSLMGVVMQVFGKILFGFFVFGIAIQFAGAGNFFNGLAAVLLGRTRGYPAKMAVVASGFLGMITGSAIANVMTTGSVTIPAMKKYGYPPHFAGAVEACASSGGALMPPVMGAVAFIMAEFLNVSYAEVCIAAAVPAVLYYLVLFVQIDAYAGRKNLQPSADFIAVGNRPKMVLKILFENMHILSSMVVLFYALFMTRVETFAPWVATGVLLLMTMVRKQTRLSFKQLLYFFEDCGRVTGELVGVLAPLGFIIGSMTLSGIAYSMPYEMVRIAQENIYLILIIGAAASFILGMGVSVAACYIFVAIVICPGLVKSGINEMAAHLFVLYCGLWSYITPPVALAAFAAAGLAEADPMRTGYTAMHLGMGKYILPFFFVLSPALILRGSSLQEELWVISCCTVGLVIVGLAFERYIWGIGRIPMISAILLGVGGFLVGMPEFYTTIIGGAMAVVIIGYHYYAGKREKRIGLGV